jgi:hypothetical protein
MSWIAPAQGASPEHSLLSNTQISLSKGASAHSAFAKPDAECADTTLPLTLAA